MLCEYDDSAWLKCDPDDLWIFDKLILSKKLGYVCGPVGVDVPRPDNYILRPITNIMGMGREAKFVWIDEKTDDLSPGHFWCEIFQGRHLSVDYINGNQTICVEGFKQNPSVIYRWNKWKRVDELVSFPSILNEFKNKYEHINCEFIGNKLIEVHLRLNCDFVDKEDVLYVVWEDQDTTPPPGMVFVPNVDYKRKGFFKHIK